MENKVNVNDIDLRFNCFKVIMFYRVSMFVILIIYIYVNGVCVF